MIWLAVGAARVAWNWLMPTTTVRMAGIAPMKFYVDIDTFCDRWLDAMRSRSFMRVSDTMYINPIQIMYAHGRRR